MMIEPGLKLDKIIFEKVMELPPGGYISGYSIYMDSAFYVAEKVNLWDNWMLGKQQGFWFFQDFSERGMKGLPEVETAAHAICLAALILKGIDLRSLIYE